MAALDDLFRLLPSNREQQVGNSGAAYTAGGLLGPPTTTQARPPAIEPPAPNRASPLDRVTESFANIPSIDQLAEGLRGPAAPPLDVVPNEPSGPSRGDNGFLNDLVGTITNAFEFISRLSMAPNYLGLYPPDPVTGIRPRPDSRWLAGIKGLPTLGDIAPVLSALDIGQNTKAAQEVYEATGLTPLDQMRQAFTYGPGEGKTAFAASQPAEVRSSARLIEELLRVPATVALTAGKEVLGANFGPNLETIADKLGPLGLAIPGAGAVPQAVAKYVTTGKLAKDAIAQTPGLPDQIGMALRDAYFDAAANPEKSSTLWYVANSLVDPTWALIPWGRIGGAGGSGLRAIAETPLVRPLVKGTAKTVAPIKDWMGSTIFDLTRSSQGHLVGESAHDAIQHITSMDYGLSGVGETGEPYIKSLRRFLGPLEEIPGSQEWLASNPRTAGYLEARQHILRYNDPKFKYPKLLDELGFFAPQTPKGQPNLSLTERFIMKAEADGLNGTQIAGHFRDIVRTIRAAELKSKNPGQIERAYDGALKLNRDLKSIWVPLALHVKAAYHGSNGAGWAGMMSQMHGPWWKHMGEASTLAKEMGAQPLTVGGGGAIRKLVDADLAPNGFAMDYEKQGYSKLVDEEVVFERAQDKSWLARVGDRVQNLPVIKKSIAFSQNFERFMHSKSSEIALLKFGPEEISRVVEREGSQPLTDLLRGAASDVQVERRLGLSGQADLRAHIDYAGMPSATAEALHAEVSKLPRGAEQAAITEAFTKTRATLATQQAAIMESIEALGPINEAKVITAFEREFDSLATQFHRDTAAAGDAIATQMAKDHVAYRLEGQDLRQHLVQLAPDNENAARIIGAQQSYERALDKVEMITGQLLAESASVANGLSRPMRGRVSQGLGDIPAQLEAIEQAWNGRWVTSRNLLQAASNAKQSIRNLYIEHLYQQSENIAQGAEEYVKGVYNAFIHLKQDIKMERLLTGNAAFDDVRPITPLSPEAHEWFTRQMSDTARSAQTGIIPREDYVKMLEELDAGNMNPYAPVDASAEMAAAHERQNAALDAAEQAFMAKAEALKTTQTGGPPSFTRPDGTPIDVPRLMADIRGAQAKARDRALIESKRINFDYAGGQRNIDQFMGLFFGFHFWPTRYMAFQLHMAAKNPAQAAAGIRVLKSWADSNKDEAWFNKLNIHYATLDAGTPQEKRVSFNPMAMFFPLGFASMEVLHSLDPEGSTDINDLGHLAANLMGGMLNPWVAMPASVIGLTADGRPPKTIEDQLKAIIPPVDWVRKGAAAAIPGGVGLLTKQESDKVIRNMTDDVNLGVLDRGQAVIAATSIAQGKPDALALEYLKQEAPARFAGTMLRAVISGMSTKTLGNRASDAAWSALNASRTAGERAAVYQAAPGMGIGIAGKTGPAKDLAILSANAPDNPVFRSMYYGQHREEFSRLRDLVNAEQATKGVADWKYRAATPESFERFRAVGGSNLIPDLVDLWILDKPLSVGKEKDLQALYDKQGMGALTYRDWRDRILPDAYYQWVAERRSDMASGRLTTVQ